MDRVTVKTNLKQLSAFSPQKKVEEWPGNEPASHDINFARGNCRSNGIQPENNRCVYNYSLVNCWWATVWNQSISQLHFMLSWRKCCLMLARLSFPCTRKAIRCLSHPFIHSSQVAQSFQPPVRGSFQRQSVQINALICLITSIAFLSVAW